MFRDLPQIFHVNSVIKLKYATIVLVDIQSYNSMPQRYKLLGVKSVDTHPKHSRRHSLQYVTLKRCVN
jgi:hypothetical protein